MDNIHVFSQGSMILIYCTSKPGIQISISKIVTQTSRGFPAIADNTACCKNRCAIYSICKRSPEVLKVLEVLEVLGVRKSTWKQKLTNNSIAKIIIRIFTVNTKTTKCSLSRDIFGPLNS